MCAETNQLDPLPRPLKRRAALQGLLHARRHRLQSLDAIHLATALAVKSLSDHDDWLFMTFDLKLGRAAAAEGLDVWPLPAPG